MSELALMPHQEEGVNFLLDRKSGLVAFEQGLGKTRVALEAFRRALNAGTVDALIVICPNSLKDNWDEEVARFTPSLTVSVVRGNGRERRKALAIVADVFVVNYEAARNDIAALRALMQRRRCALVLDESHNVKNIRTLNSICARNLAPLTDYKWLLSGTPVTNTAADMYAQMLLVAPVGQIPPRELFMLNMTLARDAESGLRQTRHYFTRKTKRQCLNLPEKRFRDVLVDLPDWQQALYDAARKGLLDEVRIMTRQEFASFAPTALTRLLRLSQLASNPALIFPEEKRTPGKFSHLDRLIDQVTTSDQKLIVWSSYVETIRALTSRYSDYGALSLYGGTPAAERQQIAASFQSLEGPKILVANPAAAGTGFTFTQATFAIYESLTWRYDLYAQSQDRNHRIGQNSPVTYIRLIGESTIEEVICQCLERKRATAERILGDTPAYDFIKQMTVAEFCSMVETSKLPNNRS